jgi:hypothetical protein
LRHAILIVPLLVNAVAPVLPGADPCDDPAAIVEGRHGWAAYTGNGEGRNLLSLRLSGPILEERLAIRIVTLLIQAGTAVRVATDPSHDPSAVAGWQPCHAGQVIRIVGRAGADEAILPAAELIMELGLAGRIEALLIDGVFRSARSCQGCPGHDPAAVRQGCNGRNGLVRSRFDIDLPDLRLAVLVLELRPAGSIVVLLEDIDAGACRRPGRPGDKPAAVGQSRDRGWSRTGDAL